MYEIVNQELEKKYKVTEYPLNLAIEVTNNCNLNCVMCCHDIMKRQKGIMHSSTYKKIIDETAIENPNTRIWLDFYGEALLTGFRLYYYIDYAKKAGLTNVCINTNGTIMGNEYADMLLDSNVDYISIDCDGFSKEVYESIRVNADRDVFYKNVEYLLKEKSRRKSNTIIDIKVIEMDRNQHEVDTILNYWKSKGAWVAVRRQAEWVGDDKNRDFDFSDRIACGHAAGTAVISWDGYLGGCAWDYDLAMKFGNVMENNVKDLWEKRNQTFVKKHFEHRWEELPEFCKKCKNWTRIGENRIDEYGNIINRNYGESERIHSS